MHDAKQPQQKHSTSTNKKAPLFFQPKLTINKPGDAYEQEADAVADKVMRMPESSFIQRKCSHCEKEEKVQRKPLAASITPIIQAKGEVNGSTASNSVTNQINATRGSGSSMGDSTKSFMESRFGADFTKVKIHTGHDAVQMSRELNAQAFTVGSDIYFNSGKYAPSTERGKHLLAHELTHTLQQNKTGGAALSPSIRRTPITNEDETVELGEEELSDIDQNTMELREDVPEGCEEDSELEASFQADEGPRKRRKKNRNANKSSSMSDKCPIFNGSPSRKRKKQGLNLTLPKIKFNHKKPITCVTDCVQEEKKIAIAHQPTVTNKSTDQNYSLRDDNIAYYVIRWNMLAIPDQIIITDQETHTLLQDSGMRNGTGQFRLNGPADIHIHVTPNDGTNNPNGADTQYSYEIIGISNTVTATITCYENGKIIGQRTRKLRYGSWACGKTREVTRKKAESILFGSSMKD